MQVALWDSLGTLLDLEAVRARFAAHGLPQGLEAWFERILHSGAALCLAGEFRPLAELAASTPPATLAQLGFPPGEREPLEALQEELRPHEEALRGARAAPGEAWLVAAHAWDVHAARLHGLNAVWVDRLEREWPLPGDPAGAPRARPAGRGGIVVAG